MGAVESADWVNRQAISPKATSDVTVVALCSPTTRATI